MGTALSGKVPVGARAAAPYLAMALLSAAIGWQGRHTYPVDFALFADAGRHIWHLQFGLAYSDQTVQAGPVQLAGLAAVRMLFGSAAVAVLHVAGSVAMGVGLMWLCRRVRAHLGMARLTSVEFAVATLACLWGWVGHAPALGHPAEALVPAMWVLAAVALRESRPMAAGALLGLATGLETWALCGFVVLWLAQSAASRLRAGALSMAVITALWAPFVFSRHFAMNNMHWVSKPGTVASAIFGAGEFTAAMRVGQLAAALAVGSVAAHALRRSGHAVWAVPLAATAVRLILDPVQQSYYWMPAMLLGLVALATTTRLRSVETAILGLIAYTQALAFGAVGSNGKSLLELLTLILIGALRWQSGSNDSSAVRTDLIAEPDPTPIGSALEPISPQFT